MICVLAAFTGTSYGTATGINILSQTHHVWGYENNVITGYSDSYDITDNVPVRGYTLGYHQDSRTGDFTVDSVKGRINPAT
jgi:hypothetical protein